MLGQFHPSRGSFTGVVENENNPKIIGQFSFNQGESFAHLAFFLPETACETAGFSELVQGMAAMAAEWGAHTLVGEVVEDSLLFERMRQSGFNVYGWQRVWKAERNLSSGVEADRGVWQQTGEIDYLAVKNLYQSLLPPIVFSAEPFPAHLPAGRVYRCKGDIVAWAAVQHGLHGVYIIPLLHPEVKNIGQVLIELVNQLQREIHLPVYLGVRSYQAWLEPALEKLEWDVMPRQALMVKRMALAQKVVLPSVNAVIAEHRVDPSTPIAGFSSIPKQNGR